MVGVGYPIIILGGMFAGRGWVRSLKEKITYPRTGFVKYIQPERSLRSKRTVTAFFVGVCRVHHHHGGYPWIGSLLGCPGYRITYRRVHRLLWCAGTFKSVFCPGGMGGGRQSDFSQHSDIRRYPDGYSSWRDRPWLAGERSHHSAEPT